MLRVLIATVLSFTQFSVADGIYEHRDLKNEEFKKVYKRAVQEVEDTKRNRNTFLFGDLDASLSKNPINTGDVVANLMTLSTLTDYSPSVIRRALELLDHPVASLREAVIEHYFTGLPKSKFTSSVQEAMLTAATKYHAEKTSALIMCKLIFDQANLESQVTEISFANVTATEYSTVHYRIEKMPVRTNGSRFPLVVQMLKDDDSSPAQSCAQSAWKYYFSGDYTVSKGDGKIRFIWK